MIHAFTGQPGAGKTLNAIKHVLEDDQFKDRPVFSHAIKGLNIPGWQEITLDEVLKWWELPEGSVIIIDECQDIWRPRTPGKAVPEHVQRLEKHRHLGIDFVLTFQFPTQIDTVVRNLITDHYHCHRTFGMSGCTIYKWERLCLAPGTQSEQKIATKTVRPFDKKIFDKYHSASLHTAKSKVPFRLYILGFFAVVLVIAMLKVYSMVSAEPDPESAPVVQSSILPVFDNAADSVFSYGDAREKWVSERTPIIWDDPQSAPIYASLHEVQSMPRLNCLMTDKPKLNQPICRCYSQQATRINVSQSQCVSYVENGYAFDYTQPDQGRSSEKESSADASSGAAPFDLIPDNPQKIRPQRYPDTVRHPAYAGY